MTKDEFELAFRRYMEEGGHSYDPWDIACSWSRYQKNPAEYDFLIIKSNAERIEKYIKD